MKEVDFEKVVEMLEHDRTLKIEFAEVCVWIPNVKHFLTTDIDAVIDYLANIIGEYDLFVSEYESTCNCFKVMRDFSIRLQHPEIGEDAEEKISMVRVYYK